MTACPGCGLRHQCLCSLLPSLSSPLSLALLTHANELNRPTNSGRWLWKTLPQCRRFVWSRTAPPAELLDWIQQDDYQPLVLFPAPDSLPLTTETLSRTAQKQPRFIVLDATWQEAAKMWRQSPWLRKVQAVRLETAPPSGYTLRRNQQPGNLCTLEVACELLRLQNQPHQAEQLTTFFHHYMRAYQADKSGHRLKQ
ncbi:tRNA-uridine aminocarboxypropyltransferase [Vibrio sp.]|uniref:tRNA-uridine aminocarboxypropyltransferase n=1 Tax=Vibrio sp. TaxID=678 RepID=UPI003D1054E5